MTRTPIAHDRIRVGDTVEAESNGMTTRFIIRKVERNRVYADTDDAFLYADFNTWFLLDRPAPPVELPKTRTLGWLSWHADLAICDTTELGMWRSTGGATVTDKDTGVPVKMLTAFVPATAVPTSALDELRKAELSGAFDTSYVESFLGAVDAANGTTP